MKVDADYNIDNPLKMLEYLICTSARDYFTHKRDFMFYGIICGWEGIPHDRYPLNEACANELDEMHEQYEELKKMFDDGVKSVTHGHWESVDADKTGYTDEFACSVCNGSITLGGFRYKKCEYNFCPHCGARMDEEITDKE